MKIPAILVIALFMLVSHSKAEGRERTKSLIAKPFNEEISKQGLDHYCGAGECDTLPELISGNPPRYPVAAQRGKVTGSAILLFDIDETGSVSNIRVESATIPEFGEAALEAIKVWKFKPATLNGEPVRIGPMKQIIPFSL